MVQNIELIYYVKIHYRIQRNYCLIFKALYIHLLLDTMKIGVSIS